MGKPTGFLEFERNVAGDRQAAQRINDWNEFHTDMAEADLSVQGARCMDCGVPFCHNGTTLAGATTGCPINNLIPDWNDMVYSGHWREALELLHKTNNFPEFTGRVCPAPCEGSCVLGINEPPVTIKNIEYSIIEKGFEMGWVTAEPPERRTGKSVAIVGSGPAGLACAAQLNKAGHYVTVFERDDRIGGLLMYGIPNMKLDKAKVVERRVRLLEQEGIRFRPNTNIGVNYPVQRLIDDYDAVVLCCGSTQPRDLSIEGRELNGIHYAMDFLKANTQSLLDSNLGNGQYISAKGKDVVVIGGGDTGTDCVGTSLRHGCNSLMQLEIMAKPPEARPADNPWPEWPRIFRVDYGQQEAAAVFGKDPREFCVLTKKFVGDGRGNLKALLVAEAAWQKDDNGRYGLKEVPGTERVVKADMVLLAMGYVGPEQPLLQQLGVALQHNPNRTWQVQAAYDRFATSVEGVFAAGDIRRGQSLVVWAINEGRAAARETDRYLMGHSALP